MNDPAHGDRTAAGTAETSRRVLYRRFLGGRGVTPWLWTAAIVAVVGDLVTTVYGLSLGLAEQNPVVATALTAFGVPGIVVLKLVAVGWVLAVWWRLGRTYGLAALAGLTLPQALAVVLNVLTILRV